MSHWAKQDASTRHKSKNVVAPFNLDSITLTIGAFARYMKLCMKDFGKNLSHLIRR
jgi:hypothetical protein